MNGVLTPMTKKIITVLTFLSVLFIVLVPMYVFAAIVPCGGSGQQACNFGFFITLIKNVINFLIFKLAVPLAAISFAVAGVMILTAGDNTGQVEKAKEIFWNVVIGLIVALSAWLIVIAILTALGARGLGQF